MNKKEFGFTVVEVLVSTLVFSLVLLGAMAALIQMGRIYQNGVITTRTQEVNRNVLAEISQSIQFSKRDVLTSGMISPTSVDIPVDVSPTPDSSIGFFCVGPARYTYALDRQLVPDGPDAAEKEKRRVLWLDTPETGCANNAGIGSAAIDEDEPCELGTGKCGNGRELLAENMRISKLEISDNGNVWSIALSLAYGDNDLLRNSGNRYECTGSLIGRENCTISELSTTVLRRL